MAVQPLENLGQLLASPDKPTKWLVEGMLSVPSKIVFSAVSGHLKSWVLLSLLLHLAAGKDWLGWKVNEPRRVIYIDEEMSRHLLKRRLGRLYHGCQFTPEQAHLAQTNFIPLTNPGFKGEPGTVSKMTKWLDHHKVWPSDLVVVETLVRVLQGDENEAKDVSAFWNSIKPLVDPASFLVSHHLIKPPEPDGKAMGPFEAMKRLGRWTRGSGDIIGGADTVFHTWRESPSQTRIWLTCSKHRDSEEWERFLVELVDGGPHQNCQPPVHHCPAKLRRVPLGGQVVEGTPG